MISLLVYPNDQPRWALIVCVYICSVGEEIDQMTS